VTYCGREPSEPQCRGDGPAARPSGPARFCPAERFCPTARRQGDGSWLRIRATFSLTARAFSTPTQEPALPSHMRLVCMNTPPLPKPFDMTFLLVCCHSCFSFAAHVDGPPLLPLPPPPPFCLCGVFFLGRVPAQACHRFCDVHGCNSSSMSHAELGWHSMCVCVLSTCCDCFILLRSMCLAGDSVRRTNRLV
jgi:hypothetical protein